MGSMLIGGMAALLMCIFLGPKFIDLLREREFGQHIREEGPEGHHAKAGTPTMGGIIIFTAVCAPFLILSDHTAQAAVLVPKLVRAGDTVLVKASRGVGLERVTEALTGAAGAPA